ncbi:TPA: hypothetical protein JG832_002427 [Enterobacter hormaechei subsp. xiangfangensis]|nr:hypothetical protein [Enterobacter hormaechei subsp. xiangfangensis]HAV1890563.1 hypothetical protein [Enterobacter hormaechei subsp. xiangfangensis]
MKKIVFALTVITAALTAPAQADPGVVYTFASAHSMCTKVANNLMFALPPLGQLHNTVKLQLFSYCNSGVEQAGNVDSLEAQRQDLMAKFDQAQTDVGKAIMARYFQAFQNGWEGNHYITGTDGVVSRDEFETMHLQ